MKELHARGVATAKSAEEWRDRANGLEEKLRQVRTWITHILYYTYSHEEKDQHTIVLKKTRLKGNAS